MKPIEIGCLAMVINPSFANFGKVSKVIGTTESSYDSVHGVLVAVDTVLWTGEGEKDSPGQLFWVLDRSNLVQRCPATKVVRQALADVPFLEKSLMRIDGDVEEESQCDEISRVKETENV